LWRVLLMDSSYHVARSLQEEFAGDPLKAESWIFAFVARKRHNFQATATFAAALLRHICDGLLYSIGLLLVTSCQL
jgi:hypothetical protein